VNNAFCEIGVEGFGELYERRYLPVFRIIKQKTHDQPIRDTCEKNSFFQISREYELSRGMST